MLSNGFEAFADQDGEKIDVRLVQVGFPAQVAMLGHFELDPQRFPVVMVVAVEVLVRAPQTYVPRESQD